MSKGLIGRLGNEMYYLFDNEETIKGEVEEDNRVYSGDETESPRIKIKYTPLISALVLTFCVGYLSTHPVPYSELALKFVQSDNNKNIAQKVQKQGVRLEKIAKYSANSQQFAVAK